MTTSTTPDVKPEVSVVIPAKNESANIHSLVSEIRSALDGRYRYELIYIDDGSEDGTVKCLLDLKQGGFEQLRLIRHKKSCGQSTAIASGVKMASGRWIVTLDADGQNDPADIPDLLDRVLAPDRDPALELVCGIRRKRNDSWIKRISSRIANRVRRFLLDDDVTDTGCGLKVFSRSLFLSLPYFDHMHRFLPALAKRAGAKLAVVDVHHRPRGGGQSNYGVGNRLWVGIVDLMGVMWLIRRAKLPDRHEER